jgi:hypothetical protein
MRRCTNLVRKWKRVEVEPATVRTHARWAKHYYFEHCGKPAVRVRDATAWCKDCGKKPEAVKEEP